MPSLLVVAALITSTAMAQTLTRAPELTAFVEADPRPPGRAAVLLVIDIDASGAVTAVEVVESAGQGFDAAAVAAARRFVFTPAEVDGAPAAVRIQYRYSFTEQIVEPPPPTTVDLTGQVVDRRGAPIVGARVRAGSQQALTDAAGRFALPGLPPGVYLVDVSAEGRVPLRATEDARTAGSVLDARYTLLPVAEDVDEERVIRAPRRILARTRVALKADEARRVAGTQGDTLKVVQSLPGVARAAAGSAALVVWGAAPEDTRVLVDGVELPALYHLGGVRSTVNSALVEDIELIPGAYGPAYGRGLGGLVRVTTRPLPRDGLTGYVGADPYDASAMLGAPFSDVFRGAAAARVGYLDRVFAGVVDDDALFPIPRYLDAQLQLEHDLRADETIGLTALFADDALERRIDGGRDRQTRRHLALSLPYRRITPAGASFTVTPHAVLAERASEARFGETPATLAVDALRIGLRADYRAAVGEAATLALGVDTLVESADVRRAGSLNRPAREGDINVFGQPPGDDVTADALGTTIADLAAHARVEVDWGPLTLVPGLRLDVWALHGDRLEPPVGDAPRLGSLRIEPTVAPRISARWRIVDGLTVHGAAGRYHQAPRPEDLSPVFGNARLGLAQADHLVLGAQWSPLDGFEIEATGYVETFDRLVARHPDPTPPLGEALTDDGSGTSRGVQLLLRRSTGPVTGWVSYTLARSIRVDAPGQAARLFDFDQTHVLSVVASAALGPLTLGGRLRYATGFPRTPVVGAFYDARSDRFQPRTGAHNSIRIPAFTQLDLRLEYRQPLPIGALSLYLDVQNATAQDNVEELAYTYDYAAERPVPGLPTLALLGARWDF